MPGPSGDTITIFTPAWGASTGVEGFQVQVDRGVVTAMGTTSTRIPPNGYVVYIRGEERVASHFRVGSKAEYRIVRTDHPTPPAVLARGRQSAVVRVSLPTDASRSTRAASNLPIEKYGATPNGAGPALAATDGS
jgi:hypothetical protein